MNNTIAILIPVHNKLDLTRQCLANLQSLINNATDKVQFKIIIIDDGSTDSTSQWVKEHFPEVILLNGDGNLWWSGAVNKGAQYAVEQLKADYILLWNNDVYAAPDYFSALSEIIEKTDKNTIVGSKIFCDMHFKTVWSVGGKFDPYSGKLNMTGYFRDDTHEWQQPMEVDWLPGMGTLVPNEVINTIGYWDAENFPQYFGDSDYTLRAKLSGFKNIVFPELRIVNDISSSGIKKINRFGEIHAALTSVKSLHNLKKNIMFYRRYAKSCKAYFTLVENYFYFFGGFLKRKIKSWFCKKSIDIL